jgi:flagellin
MPLDLIDKRICLMKIQHRDWTIGSLLSADPNSQSFHSPNWQYGTRRRSPQEPVVSADDSVSIDTHTAFGSLNNSATATVGTAITLSQTQDGFLQKVQESLQRMSELSALAQGDSESDFDRLTHATEFAQLQSRIKDLGAKMDRAASLLQPAKLGISIERETSFTPEGPVTGSGSINACLQGPSDPGVTAINNVTSASAAIATIDNALKAVKDMRVAMGTTIQRLSKAGEQLAALSEHLSSSKRSIRDVNVAEQSTRFARYDILVRSGTAMLAQANALPHSALRLLD